MSKRKWISLGIALVGMIGIAIYFVGFYPTPSERAFDKGLTYVKENNNDILSIYKPDSHGPSIIFYDSNEGIGILEAAPGEDMIQSNVDRNNASEGISIVSLAGMERHSGVLIEREDANEIQSLRLLRNNEEVVQFEIEEDDEKYSGFLKDSVSLSGVDAIVLTKGNGDTEEIAISMN
ncbi:hypothetical protein [Alkalicoccobacillus murimartini]|uniref:Uncharacterized protein n=1 Tax=Alkalicoccobacillus murimartini TaxID=171685 RepID=A0ABT9YL02_9BACI|nr:hypothetical protein [Alkalicoccobacillus murimartini]MDQ0207704.1 hypothetical protein [Alkalicoccobacillus murimartini]